MERRKFIQQLSIIAAGVLVAGPAAYAQTTESKKIRGRVLSKGKALAGVIVSDGYTVMKTDSKGRYQMITHPMARVIFVCTPAGYEFISEKNETRHYHLLKDIKEPNKANFNLIPLIKDDSNHQFIIWADPQVKNENDVKKMMDQSVPDVQKLVQAAGAGALIHGITVGDIVWDNHALYADYNKAVDEMGIPFFQCLGNHDMDLNKGGDENSDLTFQQTFGPTYYSYNRGQMHYVVMDNVRYLGKDKEYDGYIQQNQLDWLKKDLSFVPLDKTIILCLHIPVNGGTKNKEALYEIIQGRQVHIMSGHTHINVNTIEGSIYEHNHGTVCGAWWTGAICGDGTPCGYAVYKANGKDLSWHYQSTGMEPDHQLTIYEQASILGNDEILVNIWNHDPAWKTSYWVDGKYEGALQQLEGFDPIAIKTLAGPNLPNPRGFAEPVMTNHIFKAKLPASAQEVKIEAIDRFGKKYFATHQLQVAAMAY